MGDLFDYNYSGAAFELFGPAHLWTVVVLALVAAAYLRTGRLATPGMRTRMRVAIGLFSLVLDVFGHGWWAVNGAWSVQQMLPFHMCTITACIMVIAFLGGYRKLYPIIYFLGIGGALQALITPDAGVYGYPHFRFWDALLSHAVIVIGGLWVVIAEGYRPTLRSFLGTFAGLNAYAFVIYWLNRALGSNYLFINSKPATASAMDVFPEWPWYILILEVLAFTLFALLYLPFRRTELNQRRAISATSDGSQTEE